MHQILHFKVMATQLLLGQYPAYMSLIDVGRLQSLQSSPNPLNLASYKGHILESAMAVA